MSHRLDHEKLEVYQASLSFITWLEPILREVPKSHQSQLELPIARREPRQRERLGDYDYDYNYDYELTEKES